MRQVLNDPERTKIETYPAQVHAGRVSHDHHLDRPLSPTDYAIGDEYRHRYNGIDNGGHELRNRFIVSSVAAPTVSRPCSTGMRDQAPVSDSRSHEPSSRPTAES